MADARINIVQKVVIADGARPLARVDDVIEHGQAIPANVVRFQDAQRGVDRFWVRTNTDPLRFDYRYPYSPKQRGRRADDLAEVSSYFPLKVVEVDPEPQPADPLRCPTCDSPQPSMHPALSGGGEVSSVCSDGFHAPGAFDADGYLPLKGTATGDNQLDAPQPPLGVAWLREAIQRWMPDQWREQAVAVLLELDKPAESGPVVLSLPQVPDGAVALVGGKSGKRWVPINRRTTWQVEGTTEAVTEIGLLLYREGSVTVEFAPPREPRTWPKLDEVADWPEFVEVVHDGGTVECFNMFAGRYRSDTRQGYWSLHELRQHGEVREVLT